MDQRLRAIARQCGVFTRREALEVGYDDRAIAAEVTAGRWHRVRRGAFAFADDWTELDERGRHQRLARAVVRNARCDIALSHSSALMEFDTPYWDLELDTVHLTRFDRRAGRREAAVVQHRGSTRINDLTMRGGLLVTSAARVAVDITTLTDTERALVVVDGLLHARETTPEAIAQAMMGKAGWPNTLKTDLVLRLADGRSESPGETRTRYLCWREGLPTPVPQFPIVDRGVIIAWLDLAWPELKVWLEFDGAVKYRHPWRADEGAADVVLREKQREDLIRRITGWRCIRVTWADLFHPALLVEKIRRLFADQAATGRQAS